MHQPTNSHSKSTSSRWIYKQNPGSYVPSGRSQWSIHLSMIARLRILEARMRNMYHHFMKISHICSYITVFERSENLPVLSAALSKRILEHFPNYTHWRKTNICKVDRSSYIYVMPSLLRVLCFVPWQRTSFLYTLHVRSEGIRTCRRASTVVVGASRLKRRTHWSYEPNQGVVAVNICAICIFAGLWGSIC